MTAGYLLAQKKIPLTVVETSPDYLGGMARTVFEKGFYWDIGGHRFFSKSEQINQLWREILPEDFIERKRKSRIYYQKKFFHYPLRPGNALFGLGAKEALKCLLSYFYATLFPIKNPVSFEEWVRNRFGHQLFSIFFKSYTEKVWGMDCADISAHWAKERIQELSLWPTIKNALFPYSSSGKRIKTLTSTFHYPPYGPGMMWQRAGEKIKEWGGEIVMGQRVIKLIPGKKWEVVSRGRDGREMHHRAHCVISSAPIGEIIPSIAPRPSGELMELAQGLRYRDFLVVGLIVKDKNAFDDNWIYIHDPSVKVGRIQNFKAWSPLMAPSKGRVHYGMEYFCFEEDELWNKSNDDLVALASEELVELKLAQREDILDGVVIRQKKAYPIYGPEHRKNMASICRQVERDYQGLYLVGRNGMHQYNNQDHAMMTAILTVENILAGEKKFDVWQVDQNASYKGT